MAKKFSKTVFDRNINDVDAAIYSKLVISFLYIINAFVLEIAMFTIMSMGVVPHYLALNFAIIVFLSAILFVVPDMTLQRLLYWVFITVQMTLVLANCSIYKYHGDIFSLGILGFAREGAAVMQFDMLELRCVPIFAIVLLFSAFMMSITKSTAPRKFPISKKTLSGLLAIFMGFSVFSTTVYNVQKLKFDPNSNDRMLYETLIFKNAAMNRFGSFAYYFREITANVNTTLSTDKTPQEVIAYFNDYTPADNTNNPYLTEHYGAIAGDNVLVVLLESVEWYMIDELLTPTMYKLFNGYDFSLDEMGRERGYGNGDEDKVGIVFNNYYSKSKTDFSEASVLLGNYPYYESFSTHLNILNPYSVNAGFTEKNFGFAMPKMLKEHSNIEVAKYLHTYLSTFYGRPDVFPLFGFDELLFIEDFNVPYNITIGNPILDSVAMDVVLEDGSTVLEYLMPVDKQFYTQYATISTHGPYAYYDMLSPYYVEINRLAGEGMLSDLLLSTPTAIGAMAKAMDMDLTFAKIIAHLQNTGLIDNTTLLLFSDHQSYYQGIDMQYKGRLEGFTSTFAPERYRIPGAIYSTKLGYLPSDKFITYFDYAPTLFDLMAVDYNPKIYLGESLFSSEGSPCLISRTGGVLNDRIFSMDGNIIKYKKSDVTAKELEQFAKGLDKLLYKWEYVDYLYYYNLYGELTFK